MNNQKKQTYYQTYINSICEKLGISKANYLWFRLRGRKLRKMYENDCNGYSDWYGNWDEQAEIRAEKREVRLEDEIKEKAKKLNLFLFFQTDCRGATIYLDTKPIIDHQYTNAHCIY